MDACPVIVHIVVGNCVAGAVVLGVGKLVMHDSLVRRKPSVLVVVMVVVVHDGLVVIVVVVNDDMVRRERGVGEPCDAEVRLRRLGRVKDVVVLVSIEPPIGQNVEGAQDGVNTVIVCSGMLVLVEARSTAPGDKDGPFLEAITCCKCLVELVALPGMQELKQPFPWEYQLAS